MKLFRSKSQSSPSKQGRFSRMLSPTSKSDIQKTSPSKDGRGSGEPQTISYSSRTDFPPQPSPPSNQSPASYTPRHEREAEDAQDENTPSQVGTDVSAPFDERAMTRRLEDVESSFIPEQSIHSDAERFPFAEEPNTLRTAKSQTFFKWGPGYSLPRSPSMKAGSRVISEGFKPHGSPQEALEAQEAERTERMEGSREQSPVKEEEDEVDYGDTTLDSPTTAVAKRYGYGDDSVRQAEQQEAEISPFEPEGSEAGGTTALHDSQNTAPRRSDIQRALRHRHVSQQSYTSTTISDALSESTIGADYAIQTGGASAMKTEPRRPTRDEMLRLPSFGSVASSLSAGDEPTVMSHSAIRSSRLDADDEADSRQTSQYDMETPRPRRQNMPDPTDTVLAQHVRDVQVPETVARQYRASYQSTQSTERGISSTPHYGQSKSSLTLKEQNSKIDKLTKENFDLKLKIHFLSQALQDRSEEGVSDLISKNAQYQAELVRAKKDLASLRKQLRALEKQLAGQSRGSISTSRGTSTRATSQAESEDGSGSQPLTDPGELSRLRDRNFQLETENQKLVQVWQEVLNEEMDRRRAAEVKVQDLQRELDRYKEQRSPLRQLRLRRSQAKMDDEDESNSRSTSFANQDRQPSPSLGGTTVVDQLRQENVALRRDLDVQTDMLSSKNRERERLQQEVESLKLITRREESSRSSAGDSILERSISRQQLRQRPGSRASMSHIQITDVERDRYENIQANLRDENVTLKLRIQDLQSELYELEKIQVSQGDAAQALEEADKDIEYLTDAVKHLENVLQEKDNQINGLWTDLKERENENDSFRRELVSVSDSLNELTGGRDGSVDLVGNLQRELDGANTELEALEQTLHNITAAKERLEVQQESSQNEIAFLREEQENDKSKIGDLQITLGNVNMNLQNEIERLKQLERLEADTTQAREEGHQLRQALVAAESEASASADKIKELQNSLTAAHSGNNSREADTKDVSRLRRDLEDALAELNHANSTIREKDRLIVEREDLLDQMEAETKELEDELNKEKQARRRESGMPKENQRIAQLEQSRASEREQYAQLLKERNDVLHGLHTRLVNLCGPSWKSKNNVPSDTTLASRDLPRLHQSVQSAITSLEETITSFPARINDVEREIWGDFQTLDTALNSRIKRLDHVEKKVQRSAVAQPAESQAATAELTRLREDNKYLQKELRRSKQNTFELPGLPSGNETDSGALMTTQNGRNGDLLAQTGTSGSSNGGDANDQKWVMRLEEMNRRLRAEREGRLLDREGATRRLMDGQKEIDIMRKQLQRQGVRPGLSSVSTMSAQGAGSSTRVPPSEAGSVD
jgi:hypothetical protein